LLLNEVRQIDSRVRNLNQRKRGPSNYINLKRYLYSEIL
jgi:hypothetical protein